MICFKSPEVLVAREHGGLVIPRLEPLNESLRTPLPRDERSPAEHLLEDIGRGVDDDGFSPGRRIDDVHAPQHQGPPDRRRRDRDPRLRTHQGGQHEDGHECMGDGRRIRALGGVRDVAGDERLRWRHDRERHLGGDGRLRGIGGLLDGDRGATAHRAGPRAVRRRTTGNRVLNRPLAVGLIAARLVPLLAHEPALSEHRVDAPGIPVQPERQVIAQGLVGLGVGRHRRTRRRSRARDLRTVAGSEGAREPRPIIIGGRLASGICRCLTGRSRPTGIPVRRRDWWTEDGRTQRGEFRGALFDGRRRPREMVARDGEVPPVAVDLDGSP